jgi:hypothetical protein
VSPAPRSKLQRVCQPAADSSRRETVAGLLLGMFFMGIFSYGAATSAIGWPYSRRSSGSLSECHSSSVPGGVSYTGTGPKRRTAPLFRRSRVGSRPETAPDRRIPDASAEGRRPRAVHNVSTDLRAWTTDPDGYHAIRSVGATRGAHRRDGWS